jgi:hypothetical protein
MQNTTDITFDFWLETVDHGSVFVYATCSNLSDLEDRSLADRVKAEYARGSVDMAQKKFQQGNGKIPSTFFYLAIKKRELRIPMVRGFPWKPIIQGWHSL